jgi:hypothetical protein
MRNLLYAATAITALALAPTANAGLLAEYSVDGGATFAPICSGLSGTSCTPGSNPFITSNGLSFLNFSVTSNSPGTATLAKLLETTLELTNPTAATQSIEILVGDIGFALPSAPATLLENIAGTVVTGGADNLFSGVGCVDGTNAQNSCPGTVHTPVITANITAPGSGNATTTSPIPSLGTPYSITQLITLTLDRGADLNYVASASVAPVPEPATLGLLGVGLLGIGFVARRKRSV